MPEAAIVSIDAALGARGAHDHFATHPWVLAVQREYGCDLHASPEANDSPLDSPFATAIAVDSNLVVLLPVDAPDGLRDACMEALEASDLMHCKLNEATIRAGLNVVLQKWHDLIAQGLVWHDVITNAWRMQTDVS